MEGQENLECLADLEILVDLACRANLEIPVYIEDLVNLENPSPLNTKP